MQLNAIKQMERIARQLPGSISLAQGIPTKAADSALHHAAINAIQSGLVDSYSDPQGIRPLREALAAHLQAHAMSYSSEQIIVTAGAIEALSSALRVLIDNEHTEIVLPTPVYGAYFKLIEAARGAAVEVPLIEEENWRLDTDALLSCLSNRTAAILLCNPNNPTGSIYPQEVIDVIIETARQRNIMVITDEVYSNMTYDDRPFYSPAMNPVFASHVLRIMSFSKDFSLTGWRVGYAHGPVWLIERMVAMHDTMVNCAPVVSQYVAIEALRHYDRITAANRVLYRRHRDMVVDCFAKLDIVSLSTPAGGYCAFPRLHGLIDSSRFAYDLAQHGVIVVPGAAFGQGGEGHIRLCFGRSTQDVARGTKLLADYLDRLVI